MPKNDFIKKLTSLSGVPDELSNELFEKFVKRLFKRIEESGKIEVSGLGEFDIQSRNPDELIYITEAGSEIIELPVEKRGKANNLDDVFSIGYNKPLIPLDKGRGNRFGSSGTEENLIESRIDSILDNSFSVDGYESKVFDKYSFADIPEEGEPVKEESSFNENEWSFDSTDIIISDSVEKPKEIIVEDTTPIETDDIKVDFKKVPNSGFEKIRGLTSEFSGEEENTRNLTWDFGSILNEEINRIEEEIPEEVEEEYIPEPVKEPEIDSFVVPLDVHEEEFTFESDNIAADEVFVEEPVNLEEPKAVEENEEPLNWDFNEPAADEETPVNDSSHELENIVEEQQPEEPKEEIQEEQKEEVVEEPAKKEKKEKPQLSEEELLKRKKLKARIILYGGIAVLIIIGAATYHFMGIKFSDITHLFGGKDPNEKEVKTMIIPSDGLAGKPDETGEEISPLDLNKKPDNLLVPVEDTNAVKVELNDDEALAKVNEKLAEVKKTEELNKKEEVKKKEEPVKQKPGEVSEISNLVPAGNLLFKKDNKFYAQIYSFESVDKAKSMAVQVSRKTGTQLYIYVKSKTRISIIAGGFNSLEEAKAFQKPYL